MLGALALLAWLPALAGNELVIATWNIEHLAAADGTGCRPRQARDYASLRAEAARLGADVIALQEVENAQAAARVFDPAVYDFVISPRPAGPGEECRDHPGQYRLPQRTGFALHRGRLASLGLVVQPLPPLHELGDGGSARWGTRIALARANQPDSPVLELMSVHLKSGCAWNRLGSDRQARVLADEACQKLRRQRGVLEEWIDGRAAAGRPYILLGDFNRQLDQPKDDFWRAIDDGMVCTWEPDPDLGRRCRTGGERPSPAADLTLAGAGRPYPFAANPRFPYAIDQIVLGGGAADWVVPNSYAPLAWQTHPPPSDHHPIRLALRLPWAVQSPGR